MSLKKEMQGKLQGKHLFSLKTVVEVLFKFAKLDQNENQDYWNNVI